MLIARLVTASVLIPFTIMVIFFMPLSVFVAVVVFLCGLATFEWTQFVGVINIKGRVLSALLSSLVLFTIYYALSKSQFVLLVRCSLWISAIWWLTALLLVVAYPRYSVIWRANRWLKAVFGFCTIFPFFTATIILRSFDYQLNSTIGAYLLLYVLLMVWIADSAAYFTGRLCGRYKLAPSVSPGKTVEGFIGGIVISVVFSLLINHFSLPFFSSANVILISLVTVLVSVLGDLSESMFKRIALMKDSGSLILGHGGILDRIDSLTAAIPIFVLLIFTF